MKYILLFLLLTSCASRKAYYINPEFRSYVETFEDLTKRRVAVTVNFGELPMTKAGTCQITWFSNTVTINPVMWEYEDEMWREQLIMHELGHCVLGLDHDSRIGTPFSSIAPRSIMNPYVFGNSGDYRHNREYYFLELLEKM